MPLQATSGAASYDAFGGGVAVVPNYIEDVFSTWLYTGNDSSQTINNGVDLAGKGGLVWVKARNQTYSHILSDTSRGTGKFLSSNTTDAQGTDAQDVTAFNANGFTVGNNARINNSSFNYASWTFRKSPKFFDVVTYTGNGTAGRTVAHNLGSVPGCIIVKKTSGADAWAVYHRGVNGDTGNGVLVLSSTAAQNTNGRFWWGDNTNFIAPTSTNFTVATDGQVNENGATYVAYLFAHNAGGFGLTGTDNVISCGSFTADGSGNATINLGYEPQWVMVKRTDSTSNWFMVDSMRGNPTLITSVSNEQILRANTSDAESSSWGFANPTATGFQAASIGASSTWIYIAIRRGPMKVPTTGTSVFSPIQAAGGTGTKLTTNFPVDFQIWALPGDGGSSKRAVDRLRGVSSNTTTSGVALFTDLTSAEDPASVSTRYWDNTGYTIPDNFLGSGLNAIYWNFRRAPGFFDEVCWTATGSAQTLSHNLGVVPELMIRKRRDSSTGGQWDVYVAPLGATNILILNGTSAVDSNNTWNNTTPTSSVVYMNNTVSGWTYVTYLFASCPGVSKVGSYTGNGSSQTINCGFTGGARFVMIKRTDSTGDWYVWDTARGIVSGNDPHLSLNTTAAEVTSNDTIDTDSTGFVVNQVSATNVNVSSATYIFMSVA